MNCHLISVYYLVFIKVLTEFCQLMTADAADFQLQIPPLILEWWLWLDLCATLDSLCHFLSLPHNFAADYQLNSWSQTPSVAQKSAHGTWPAFNGGGPRSKISCFGGLKISNFAADAGLTHQLPNQTEHIFGTLRPISFSWQSFSCNPWPPIFGEEKAVSYRLFRCLAQAGWFTKCCL